MTDGCYLCYNLELRKIGGVDMDFLEYCDVSEISYTVDPTGRSVTIHDDKIMIYKYTGTIPPLELNEGACIQFLSSHVPSVVVRGKNINFRTTRTSIALLELYGTYSHVNLYYTEINHIMNNIVTSESFTSYVSPINNNLYIESPNIDIRHMGNNVSLTLKADDVVITCTHGLTICGDSDFNSLYLDDNEQLVIYPRAFNGSIFGGNFTDEEQQYINFNWD